MGYLVGIAPFFAEPERSDLIADAFRAAASIRNPISSYALYRRFSALAEALPLAMSLGPDRLLNVFVEVLRVLEFHPREEFLYDLAAIAPMIAQIGGSKAGQQLADDISLVTSWWP